MMNLTEYTITITAEELTILNDAVIKEPFCKVAPLIGKIREQIRAQEDEYNLKQLALNTKNHDTLQHHS